MQRGNKTGDSFTGGNSHPELCFQFDHMFPGNVKQVFGLAEDVTYEILLQEKIQNEGGEMRQNKI
jgi:hypothetical protein